MADVQVPDLSDGLLTALNALFPEQSPDPSESEREIWMKAGERRLIRFLNEQYVRQNETILE